MTDAQKPMTFEECVKAAMQRIEDRHFILNRKPAADHFYQAVLTDEFRPLFEKQQREEKRLHEIIENYRVEVDQFRYLIREQGKVKNEQQATNEKLKAIAHIHQRGVFHAANQIDEQQATLAERDKEIVNLRLAVKAAHDLRVHLGYGSLDWAAKYGDTVDPDEVLKDLTAQFDVAKAAALAEQPERKEG